MTSSTVCVLPELEKSTMAADRETKKRKTLENSLNGVSRNSTFINYPQPGAI